MVLHERVPQSINGDSLGVIPSAGLFEVGPSLEDRVSLESVASAGTVDFYLLTEAAHSAWAAISARLASGAGVVFWIGGPAGAGKTPFLHLLEGVGARAR